MQLELRLLKRFGSNSSDSLGRTAVTLDRIAEKQWASDFLLILHSQVHLLLSLSPLIWPLAESRSAKNAELVAAILVRNLAFARNFNAHLGGERWRNYELHASYMHAAHMRPLPAISDLAIKNSAPGILGVFGSFWRIS